MLPVAGAASVVVASVLASWASAGELSVVAPHHWDAGSLFEPPQTLPAPDYAQDAPKHRNPELGVTGEGVRPLFYEGLPWQGKPTRVFAWYGVPELAAGERAPGMVLVHGGGGTAFDEWVRIWNRRGYAAIAMDVTGSRPGGKPGQRPRHEWGGPPHDGMTDVDRPVGEQWVYHAVADVVLAHSLLRSFPEVDAARVGLTGISWGGFLTCLVAAVDPRFRFAIPVYGCGFLNEGPVWKPTWEGLGPERTAKWHALWDPANYVAAIEMPTLWVNGSNDRHFPLSIHGKTFARCGGTPTLSVGVGMGHSHVHGWKPGEIYVYADSMVRNGPPLAKVTEEGRADGEAWVRFQSPVPVKQAEFVHASDLSDWAACAWEQSPARLDAAQGTASAAVPPDCRAYFFNLTDEHGLLVSTNRTVVAEASSGD